MANFVPKITYIELVTGTPKSFTFDSEPEGDPFKETYVHIKKDTRSNNGTKQTQFNYTLKKFDVQFTFQTEITKDAVLDLILNHASRGGDFNYFIHSDEVEFEVFQYVERTFRLARPIPNGAGDFEYDFRMKFERVE